LKLHPVFFFPWQVGYAEFPLGVFSVARGMGKILVQISVSGDFRKSFWHYGFWFKGNLTVNVTPFVLFLVAAMDPP